MGNRTTKVEIICEIGINHGGDFRKVKKMINLARISGADTIKFQTVNPDLIYKKSDPLYDIFKKVQFKLSQWRELKKLVEDVGMEFLSTPGDKESVDLLDSLGVKRFKIASDSFADIDFVNYVIDKGKPFLVSTGMAKSIGEISETVSKYSCPPAVVFHCVSKYPPAVDELNLERITQLKSFLVPDIKIGYSDHLPWVESALVGVMKGASVIEKHFKLSANDIDASVSLDLLDFWKMSERIRKLEQIL
jgi:sialic acid synthase SpsE